MCAVGLQKPYFIIDGLRLYGTTSVVCDCCESSRVVISIVPYENVVSCRNKLLIGEQTARETSEDANTLNRVYL